MFTTLLAQLGLGVMLAVCGAAILAGGRIERLVAVVSITAWIGSAAVQHRGKLVYFDPGVFSIDVAFLIFLAILAVQYDQAWLLFSAAYQLLAVATHLSLLLDHHIGVRGRMFSSYAWNYLNLVALAVGTWQYRRRSRGGWTTD